MKATTLWSRVVGGQRTAGSAEEIDRSRWKGVFRAGGAAAALADDGGLTAGLTQALPVIGLSLVATLVFAGLGAVWFTRSEVK
ncbi:MAG: hypothetical protein M1401_08825 [Chloroflexi bacterium]|nr:hypothetical protein [Chloroflexota bacterium]